MTKVIQTNLNNSNVALDNLKQKMNESQMDIAVISEPPKNKGVGKWIMSIDDKAAIYINDKKIRVKNLIQEEGYAGCEIKGFVLISAYFSPNKTLRDFERFWEKLADKIRKVGNTRIILAGDLNAKHVIWTKKLGRQGNNKRGEIIAETLNTLNLTCCNKGMKATCKKPMGESVVDITIATDGIVQKIKDWKVLDDETLSDHEYINYRIDDTNEKVTRREATMEVHWNIEKMNKNKLRKEFEKMSLNCNGMTLDEEVEHVEKEIRKICNAAMTQKKIKVKKNAYWWNESIATIRRKCVRLKRILMRNNKRSDIRDHTESTKDLYMKSRKELKMAIYEAKKEAWKKLVASVENDVWGLPYRILRGKNVKRTEEMTREETTRVIKELFPRKEERIEKDREEEGEAEEVGERNEVEDGEIEEATEEEIERIIKSTKNKKAPGPDGIPNEILKILARYKLEEIRNLMNRCLRETKFPKKWKECNIVLIPKGEENSGKYRPISLLNTLGKILEKILEKRLQDEVKQYISNRQYGFKQGIGTMEAVKKVVNYVEEGMKKGLYTIAVTIDIKNAFNTANWDVINQELKHMKVRRKLRDIIASYLSERSGKTKTEDGVLEIEIERGVPQGSVLGPLLWNILYNQILNLIDENENELIICYADDTLLLVRGKSLEDTRLKAEGKINDIVTNIEKIGLKVEPKKSEMIYFTKKRLKPRDNKHILIKRQLIEAKKYIVYLGIILDYRLNFMEQIKRAGGKAIGILNSLGPIIKNLTGPTQAKRRLLAGVSQAVFLYGAPIWANAIQRGENKKIAVRVSRLCALRVAAAYRTISNEAVHAISGVPQMDILARKRKKIHEKCKDIIGNDKTKIKKNIKKQIKEEMLEEWQEEWVNLSSKAEWTRELIPDIRKWMRRKHGEVDYHLTQVLSGHGVFNSYLYRFKKRSTDVCNMCGCWEDTQHVIFNCPRWKEERGRCWETTKGEEITSKNLIEEMLGTPRKWKEIAACIKKIIAKKEEEDRREGY
ncbi:Putative 115 kDa protein in type-1 retrotransposable element R1DM [Anthophora quadrimaculata]